MPISYTKRGWTNNSPPAINAANLGAMDDGIKQACDGVDALNVAPVAHAARHKHGGADEIATGTPGANAIPKADGSGKLDSWVSDASASTKGKVQLAIASELVTGTDDTKAPTTKQLKDATALDGFWLTKRTKMPDGATAVYAQGAWATIDSWFTSIAEGTLSVNNGALRYVRGSTNGVYVRRSISSPGMTSKIILVRYRASKNCTLGFCGYSTTDSLVTLSASTDWQVSAILSKADFSTGNDQYPSFYMTADSASGDWFEIDWIWIGNYSYLVGSLSEEAARISNQIGDTAGVGAKATTTLTSNGTNVSNGDKVTLAGKGYTFKTALTPAEGEVLIGATYTDSLDNLVAAITGGAGNGTLYSCAAAHPLVTASRNGAVVTITALQAGILGNQITASENAATLTLANPAGGTTTLAGGVDAWGAKAKSQLDAALGAGALVGALPNRTNSNVIGYFDVVDCASGAQVTLPAGGTWVWMVETYGATYGGSKRGTAAGGAAISGTASANLVMYYERIA